MKTFKLALAGLAALGAAVVAAPEPANAGSFSIRIGFGHGYHGYGYGYRPVHYGYYPAHYGYYRKPVRKIIIVKSYPRYHYWHHPYKVRYVSYGHKHYWKHKYRW